MHYIFYSLIFLLSFGIAQANLPVWSDEDKARLDSGEIIVGQALLTRKGVSAEPLQGENPTDSLSDNTSDTPPRPNIVRPIQARPDLHPTPPIQDNRQELSRATLARYFNQSTNEGIFDPQQVLSSQEKLDIKYALSILAEESPIPVFFYIFDENQKVTPEYHCRKMFNQHYYDQSAAILVYYFVGQPERSQLHFGGKDATTVPRNKVRELITGVRLAAKQRSNQMSQLDEFVRHLSLHLFWIEKAIEEQLLPHEKAEVTDSKEPSADSFTEKIIGHIISFSQYSLVVSLGSLLFICSLCAGVYYVRRRQFSFPKIETSPRLNLPNGGSMGGTVSYKDHNLPPSAQTEQFDTLF